MGKVCLRGHWSSCTLTTRRQGSTGAYSCEEGWERGAFHEGFKFHRRMPFLNLQELLKNYGEICRQRACEIPREICGQRACEIPSKKRAKESRKEHKVSRWTQT